MPTFEVRNDRFKGRIEDDLMRQPFAQLIGLKPQHIAAGEVDLVVQPNPDLAQQHGFVHGGVITALADTAAGFAAMTLAGASVGVLTTELKVNFLRPARFGTLVAKGRVIKSGRTLNVVQADVFEPGNGEDVHILTGLITIMFVEGLMSA